MAGYSPLKITGMQTGLVQDRENFLLPDDAYPVLQNAYVWRERILRKKGYQLLGRLRRNLTGEALGNTNGGGGLSGNIISLLGLEATSQLAPASLVITVGAVTFTDNGQGKLIQSGSESGDIYYSTGEFVISGAPGATAATAAFGYYPGLPVMGIREKEQQGNSDTQTIFFDQKYAYIFNASNFQFEEYLPLTATTWNASGQPVSGTEFFFSTNYWQSSNPPFTTTGLKLFWVTNNSGTYGALADSPRITDGVTWVAFDSGAWHRLNSSEYLFNFLAMLPFRGRMVTFNTWEGTAKNAALNYPNRIRWSTIGNPFIAYSAGPPATGSWRDDIRGQGGYLDIPTSEDIVSVGFVRDNLVIYCERSTWQLRYTGRTISPFQIERVNSELGAESTFSAIQFDTSLLGVGDKGIVECDSYKSQRIDIKIPDFVFQIHYLNNGTYRTQGIRDFPNRLAFWSLCLSGMYDASLSQSEQIFPNQRLVYNYENDSWAMFNDSLTALGTYQEQTSRTWLNTTIPWVQCDFNWIDQPQSDPVIVGGNQQGFVENLDELTTNDPSLYISNIVGSGVGSDIATVITCPNHNMNSGFVIGISGIAGSAYSSLNTGIFSIVLGDSDGLDPANKFRLFTYNSQSGQFDIPREDAVQTYVGGGLINIRENFSIVSKKFNFLDQGESIQMGYIDVLMESSGPENPGAISLNVCLDYDDINASNTLPNNEINNGSQSPPADTFFNSIIPTTSFFIVTGKQIGRAHV